ncbi:MAG: hypothetical protein ACRYGH_02865 [Janthinobacterium lividum]
MPQTAEQLQAARELAQQFGLNGADFYQHKQSKSFLISRTGIEKIQYKAGIEVGFEAVRVEPEFAAVKALASRKVKTEGKTTATKLTIQTFGSACKLNCQVSYYLEMAEKRALSRAVLKLADFYQLGVYGEDELPPSVMQEASTPAALPPATATPVAAESPKKPVAEASVPVSADPAPSITSGLSNDAEAARIEKVSAGFAKASQEFDAHVANHRAASNAADPAPSTSASQNVAGPSVIPAEVLAKFTRQFEAATSGIDVKKLWDSLTKNEATALFDAKEAAKARLAKATEEATALATRQAAGTMRVAGDDTSLVEEFGLKPVFGPGPAVDYATGEQQQEIKRLLNNPLITRKEKTYLLLSINKLDKERARQAIVKLRGAIADREGIDPRDGVRASIKSFVLRNATALTAQQAEDLNNLAADATATLEFLVEALDLATSALVDDQTYGTDAELDEAETAIAA